MLGRLGGWDTWSRGEQLLERTDTQCRAELFAIRLPTAAHRLPQYILFNQ